MRPYMKIYLLSILCMILTAVLHPIIASLIEPLIDDGIIEQDAHKMLLIPIWLALLMTIKAIFSFFSNWSASWISLQIGMDLRRGMFSNILSFPIGYFGSHTEGSVSSKFSYESNLVQASLVTTLTAIFLDGVSILALLSWLFYKNWLFTLLALLGAPLILLTLAKLRKRIRRMQDQSQHSTGEIIHLVGQAISALKVIKIFGSEAQERQRFTKVINRNRQQSMKVIITGALGTPLVQIVLIVPIFCMVYVANQQILAGQTSLGEFIAFFTGFLMLTKPLKNLSNINQMIHQGLSAAASIFALIDVPAEQDNGHVKARRVRGRIDISQLQFSYRKGGPPALNGVNLEIQEMETVALVGPSGSGKSTLINLIARFYEPDAGYIRLDGQDQRAYTLDSYRSQLTIVNQEVVLFDDTIRNNVCCGAEPAEADLQRAIEDAYVTEFTDSLPDGLDTQVGENGMQLSAGQRQRIAIARALLRNPPILIFDEATSALDAISERYIQAALRKATYHRTCIIIAHHLTTVQNADRIAVIRQGRIIETGTHTDLLQRAGLYAKLQNSVLSP